jgi:hypothetical protein
VAGKELIYVIAENHRVAIQYLEGIGYTGSWAYVHSAGTLRDGEQGLLYAIASAGQSRKDWPELLDMLAVRGALHY